jgi:amino acid adenylation domain-containing protein
MNLAHDILASSAAVSIDAESSLPAHFERVVAIHATRPALASDTWQATYAELNAAANRLAHELLRRGAPGDRIAILMAHDTPQIAAVLAVLKAGRVDVVLNPTFPAARLRQLLQDAQVSAIVTDAAHQAATAELAPPGCDVILFDPTSMVGPTHNPGLDIPAGATAFLTFTSGSTGEAKAVMQTHRLILHNAVRHNGVMEFTAEDRLTLFGSLSGAQGISNAWCALAFGAVLCPFPVIDRGFNGLADFIEQQRITVFRSSASLFRQFMRALPGEVCFTGMRLVNLLSEPATSDDFEIFKKHFPPSCSFGHMLSSSETGAIALMRLAWHDTVPEGTLPIGSAAEGVEILLLDEAGNPVGPDEAGEIAIRTEYLAAGYWRNAGPASVRFSTRQDGRNVLYRSGDMGRFNADGLLAHDSPTTPAAVPIDAESSLPAHFERVVAIHATRPALASDTWQATYAELNATANRLAHALLRRGAPGDRIAILMAHDTPQIAAVLAVLKAGRIDVVLNPTFPAARLGQLLQDAQVSAIVTDAAHQAATAELAPPGCDVILFDPTSMVGPTHNPGLDIPAGATAFLTFTSGSTGIAKAVMQTHRLILHNAVRHNGVMEFTAEDRLTLFGSLSGGQGISNAWCALAFGAVLCPFPVIDRGFNGLADFIEQQRITVFRSSASLFRQFMRTLPDHVCFTRMRVVRLSSEPATSDDFETFKKHFPPGCSFVHTLSSSETGNMAQARLSWHDTVPEGVLPIGRASEGVEILLLDEAGNPVGPGEAGEIAIRTKFLAAGYWRDSGPASDRFATDKDERKGLYRTGDMGRFNADGQLLHLGRKDARVKLRGYRIDLSEIEGALLRLLAVDKAIVGTIERAGNEPRLVAYLILRSGHAASAGAIRSSLRAALPRHMVPSAFVFFEEYPLTPHGKIDRERLRQTYAARSEVTTDDAPRTETEILLAGVWRDTFDLSEVGRNDDFMDLGGDSLMAAVIAAGIHDARGIEIDIATFFEHPVLADLARVVDGLQGSAAARPVAPAPRDTRTATFPLAFGQEFYWRWSQSQNASAIHTGMHWVRMTGPLDRELLRGCVEAMTQRHESFRTSFRSIDGQPVQVVHPDLPLAFEFHDLSTEGDPDATAKRLLMGRKKVLIDIERPPLISFVLLRLRPQEHWLATIGHHIVLDGWSWNIFFRELGRIYQARVDGAEPNLDPPRRYEDFTRWQRETFRPGHSAYRDGLLWWIDHVLAATYPDRPAYRRALLACVRLAPALLPFAKKLVGLTLRGVINVPRPPRTDLPLLRAEAVSGLDPAAGMLTVNLAPDTSRRLTELGRAVGASHFAVRMAAYAGLIAAETGNENVAFGTHFSTRNRAVALDVIGFCANHAMLLLRCDRAQTFRQFVAAVRDRVRAVQSHGDFPYEVLHREMRAWRIRLPRVQSLAGAGTTQPDTDFAGIRLTNFHEDVPAAMPGGFEMKFNRHGGNDDELELRFDAHRYDPEAVRALVGRLVRLLDVVSQEPDLAMAEALARAGVAPPGAGGRDSKAPVALPQAQRH